MIKEVNADIANKYKLNKGEFIVYCPQCKWSMKNTACKPVCYICKNKLDVISYGENR